MLIDWFTVFAQIVNFLVLVWLLKIFLYKPILKMITDRQNEIAKQLSEAEIKKREADEESLLFQNKNKEFEQQKAERIKKLNEEIKQLQDNLRAEAKQDVEEQRTKWLSNLKNEKEEVFRDLTQKVQAELFSIMRKVMADLADTDIQDRLVDVFLQNLKMLPQKEKGELLARLHASKTLEIKIASEPKENIRNKIKAAVQQEFGREFDVHFIVLPELIGGIELLANGQKISWNIADYLTSLESLTNEVVHKNSEYIHA
jgi:F-type H+-transporting ATPase subunit b